MARRLFNFMSLLSTVLLGCTLVLSLSTHWLNPWDHRISFTPQFHAGVDNGRSNVNSGLGKLVFCSSEEWGPAFCVITGGIGSDGKVHLIQRLDRDVLWNSFGVYYRCLYYHDRTTLWTLSVDLGYPFLAFAILPSIWAVRRYKPLRLVHKIARWGNDAN